MVFCSCSYCFIAILFFGLYLIQRYIREKKTIDKLATRAVIISGCDSGFGRALALKCLKSGMTVFAGCLTKEGQESLKKESSSNLLHTVALDVTKDESVAAAREYVNKNIGAKKLWAVVNNAGIFTCYGMADWCTIKEYQLSFEVNTLGGIRLTNAFIDLIKKNEGRIISVSSVAGRISTAGAAPYNVAKYGVEAWMDTIRRELLAYNVKVILLEPGAFKATNLLDKEAMANRVNSVWNKMGEEKQKEYGNEFKETFIKNWNNTLHMIGSDKIDYVVDNYFHAITAKHPRLRYQCGWDAILLWIPLAFLPTPIQDYIMLLLIKNKAVVPAALQPGGKLHHAKHE